MSRGDWIEPPEPMRARCSAPSCMQIPALFAHPHAGTGENLASVVPPVVGPLLLPSDTMPSTEFVTNATSTSGGAVNRPFTFILKTCPAIGS